LSLSREAIPFLRQLFHCRRGGLLGEGLPAKIWLQFLSLSNGYTSFYIGIQVNVNKLLYKIKVKDNAFCTFCQEDEETIEHLFWNCETRRSKKVFC
jgi:hypothetical protein